ncbi:MAG: hypothetical protein Q8936_16630 [Bacillota bacterium]|nr:hypothetical protein [Bacillota bacterium]
MKRHSDIPTAELIEELRLRSGIKDMVINSKEMYRIDAMGKNGEKHRFVNVDKPTVIIIAPKIE